MAYVPWKNFARIVDRHGGDKGVPAHSALVDALNLRDWRIDHALAMGSGGHELKTGDGIVRPLDV